MDVPFRLDSPFKFIERHIQWNLNGCAIPMASRRIVMDDYADDIHKANTRQMAIVTSKRHHLVQNQ